MAQLLRKTNLAEIFSEARSGTITHKNKKNYGRLPMDDCHNSIFSLFHLF